VAQDVVPAPRSLGVARPLQQLGALLQRADLLPLSATPGRVALSRRLVAYVASVATVALVVAALAVRWPSDWATLTVGSFATFLLAVYAVRSRPGTAASFAWSPSLAVNLGLSVTLGPIGAAAAAVGEGLGVGSRTRGGWFRTIFNISSDFLSNISAYAAFTGFEALAGKGPAALLGAGLVAGVAQYVVNHSLVVAVILVSTPTTDIRQVLRNSLSVLHYSVGYGLAAFTYVVMLDAKGVAGFVALLAPTILLQIYLVQFAHRVQRHEEQRAAYEKEKEKLQVQVLEASEAERRKIARDLHDGVVQNLAGMAFALSAQASQLKSQPVASEGRDDLIEVMEQSATETRGAMKDLRTLIIELAPPTLRREGLQAALLEVLSDIKRKGTSTKLDLPSNLRLREDRAALILRVAHEVLRNVAAHAHAKNVTVALTTADGSAILSIQDDGKGFSASEAQRRRAEGHLGTTAIVELAEEAGGTLTIDSEPGHGTLVVLKLPIR
jgi:signal transduction histidine kinase